ncbi:MAG: ABC transporter substrate-binding protein [Rhodospirillaceae bacterium]|jgi:branched-chain amino acid transport system substrate-binding protein|nr:ABC transporter substrate-binding protein [Rhodospirillaceae bacterium]
MKRSHLIGLLVVVVAVVAAIIVFEPFKKERVEKVTVGFVTTLSKGPAIIGKHMQDAANLALEHAGGKLGDIETEIVFVDDEFDPEVGRLRTEELVKQNKADFVAGYIWSHVLLQSRAPILKAETFLISTNAGPHQMAGEECSPFFFSTSWQNDQTPEAMGEYLNQAGIKRIFVISPNYPAGKDMASGVRRTFKGEIVGEIFTPWPSHADWSAEFAKVRAADPKPEAVFAFYPGGAGIKFVKQYDQSGLKADFPLYTVFTTDTTTLGAQGDAALGMKATMFWSPDLDTPANKKFVADFEAKYGYTPSSYAAQTYDGIMLIDSAVRAVGGNLADKDAVRKALEAADFDSVRGGFKFNTNHFPIQNFYLREVVKDENGKLMTKIVATVLENAEDAYAKDCKM